MNNESLGSPFTARILRLLADRLQPDTALARRLFNWPGDIGPGAASVPLRLLGGLHALALRGDAPNLAACYPPNQSPDEDRLWRVINSAMRDNVAFLETWLNSPPQTNEVRRAAVMIAAGNLLAAQYGLPMVLSELGASGGLNLMWDKFGLKVGNQIYGPKDSAFILSPDWTGPAPPNAGPVIVERRGVDLNPLNPRDPNDALRLTAYLWADQPERLARTRAAMAIASAPVDKGDAGAWLAQRLTNPRPDHLHLIYHTIAWQYFPPETQHTCLNSLEAAGRAATPDAPLARLSMEADGGKEAAITLWLWPEGRKIALGRVDFHGRWLKWQAG